MDETRELTQADALPEESPEEFAAKICDLFEGKPIPSYIVRNGQAKTELGTVTAFAPEVKRAMATDMIVRALRQAAREHVEQSPDAELPDLPKDEK